MLGGRGDVHAAFVSSMVTICSDGVVAPYGREPAVPAVLADGPGRMLAAGHDPDAELSQPLLGGARPGACQRARPGLTDLDHRHIRELRAAQQVLDARELIA